MKYRQTPEQMLQLYRDSWRDDMGQMPSHTTGVGTLPGIDGDDIFAERIEEIEGKEVARFYIKEIFKIVKEQISKESEEN